MQILWSFSPHYCVTIATWAGQPQDCSPPFWQHFLFFYSWQRRGTNYRGQPGHGGRKAQCTFCDKHGKSYCWHQDGPRHFLPTQWLTGTFKIHRIWIVYYKQVLVKIWRTMSHSSCIRSVLCLQSQLQSQSKWFWKCSLPRTWCEPRTLPFNISRCFSLVSSSCRMYWVYSGKE